MAAKRARARRRAAWAAAGAIAAACALMACAAWGCAQGGPEKAPGGDEGGNDAAPAISDTMPDTASAGADSGADADAADTDAGAASPDPDAGPPALAGIEPADMDAIPSGAQVSSFSLSGADAASLSPSQEAAIEDALAAVETLGSVGVAFVDMSTGRGVAYNVDEAVYGASSFKGPYAVYVCEELVEDGSVSLDTPVDVASGNPGSIAIDPGSWWAASGAGAFPAGELIAAAITQSDNDAYGMLRNQFDLQGYDEWTARLGVADAPRNAWSWYPTYCARSSAKLWAEALSYLESGTETSAWLSGLFEQTETSFIRDGLARRPGGADAVVRDKAGWCADADPAYNGVCDAGIIEAGGRTYLMCIMTGAPDCIQARDNVSALAAALFDARDALA